MWWPRSHSRSGDPDCDIVIEPAAGGRIYERTPSGAEHDWGEVLAWEPPRRIKYLWHIYGDRSDASEVEITFTPDGPGTSVSIVHGGWERLGAKGPDLRERNQASWANLIPHFVAACRT